MASLIATMSVFTPSFVTSPKVLEPVSNFEPCLLSTHGGYSNHASRLSQSLIGRTIASVEGFSLHTLLSHSNNPRKGPFKPQKAAKGSSSWQLKQFADATLGSGSLKKAVQLPEGEDENEWVAVNG